MPHTICDTLGRVTKEETRARDVLRSTIRLCYLSRPPYGDETIRIASDEFKELVTEQTPLSEAYALLTPEQKAKAREITENPAVRFYGPDRTERWIDENLDLLARLEAGTPVGPVGEKQIVRTAGAKAILDRPKHGRALESYKESVSIH